MIEERKFLTAKELSKILEVSVQHIYQMAQRNQITHYKIGQSLRFPKNIMNELLRERINK